ncbi:Alpha/Beta hydrolase protein [Dendryphion nanum]|uniref:Carboxylic ester hydrolase n=1 Tax=Dendryphion nanum TaxID=256645 RepID=A0A9P9D0M4_9PLEO|nr:Alpha/Beta hydrolase protein [Dendryphion nanum]
MPTPYPDCGTFTFTHPQLGQLTGVSSPHNVIQFRAIPYATIPARFERSSLLHDISHTDHNFTKPGYACPQIFGDDTVGGGPFPDETSPPQSDEFQCLILQINVPLAVLQSSTSPDKLPVLVYIHGGGFVLGKIDPQHNTALMVEQSILDSQPTISASIQYRLGALGYLQTPEPNNSNLALHDQRNALLWIQKFIGGFGGDHRKVTVFGESAGSMSICYHMLSAPPEDQPLFNRVILQSGALGPMSSPLSVQDANELFENLLRTAEIVERGREGLAKLRELSVDKIVDLTAKLSGDGVMWLPVQDEDWFGSHAGSVTWDRSAELISQCEWIEEVVMGCTSFEGTTFMAGISGITPRDFIRGIADQLGNESAEVIGRAYHISAEMDQNLFINRALRWVGDVVFDAPMHALAKSLSRNTTKKVYRYVFNVRNPFPNHHLYQQPHHWVDVYYVFKTFQFRYPTQRLKDISTRHAQLWVEFANGKSPWAEYNYTGTGDEVVIVADEREGWVERSVAEDERIMETSWRRCEALWESWKNVEGRPFVPLKIEPLKGKKLV